MVLFYCTFVAMKRQDRREIPIEDLLDDFELAESDDHPGENVEFGGKVRDGDLRHALRVFKDRASGVVRLEASALRGPMADVPLWTAFVSKYARDPDWAELEGDGVVSLVALRPKPYVFLAGYQPPMNRKGEYILQFTTRSGKPNSRRLQHATLTRSQMLRVSWRPGLDCADRIGNGWRTLTSIRLYDYDMWDLARRVRLIPVSVLPKHCGIAAIGSKVWPKWTSLFLGRLVC